MRKYISFIVMLLVISSCNEQGHFASSFGKRKYNKGYFWNLPEKASTIIRSINDLYKANLLVKKSEEYKSPAVDNKAETIKGGQKINTSKVISLVKNNEPRLSIKSPGLITHKTEQVYENTLPNNSSTSSNKIWEYIAVISFSLFMLFFFAGLFLFKMAIGQALLSICYLFYFLGMISAIASIDNSNQDKSKPIPWGLFSFIDSLFSVLIFLALPNYKLWIKTVLLLNPNYAIIALIWGFLFTIYYAIRALLQKDSNGKGLAIAATIITAITFILFLLFPTL